MRRIIYCIVTITALTACSSMNPWSQNKSSEYNNNEFVVHDKAQTSPDDDVLEQSLSTLAASAHFQNHYKQQFQANTSGSGEEDNNNIPSKTINDYARGIMQDLVANLQYVNASTPMAVTSFVFLGGDYASSGLLGKQLAESFVHESHKYGIPIIDFKTTDFVRVTADGDFVLSRDYLELSANLPVEYVLTGTLVRHPGGVLVNARIVGIKSKAVVASAQGFLPARVCDTLLNSELNSELKDGIALVKG
jgi:TolB-like protein